MNPVTSVEISERNAHDAPFFPSLVGTTARNFTLRDVSADKAYSSKRNLATTISYGATPYIPFKEGTTGGVEPSLWQRLWHFYQFKRDAFLPHYHRRSNVESTFSMIKAKFGDALRSKTDAALINEALAKILCHNVCVLIQSMYELGIE